MKELFVQYTDEIAMEVHGMEFHELPENAQRNVIDMANKRAESRYADECDHAYEQWKERNIPLEVPECPKGGK